MSQRGPERTIIRNPAERAVFSRGALGKSDLFAGGHLFVGLNAFEPGQVHEPHAHCDRDKLYHVLRGQGEMTIGPEMSRVGPGDVAFAAADVVHSLRNPGPERLVVLVVIGPPPEP